MTDKQVIIDGVNITGCAWCDFEPDAEPYCRINDGEDLGCEDNPNCYFKQLAHKTQECEQLKERIKCNCFDPKSNNNRCISYNRIAEDYERDLILVMIAMTQI